MEKTNRNIQITGIARQLPPYLQPDGAAEQLVNLHPVNGIWKPVKPYKFLETIPDPFTLIYYHPHRYVFYHYYVQDIFFYRNGTRTVIYHLANETLVRLHHYGNILVVVTDKNIYYFLYDSIEDNYTYLHDPFAHTGVSIWSDTVLDIATGYYSSKKELYGAILKYFDENWHNESKWLTHLIVRYAFKLVDGSYILHSNAHYIKLGTGTPEGAFDIDIQYDASQGYRAVGINAGDLVVRVYKNEYLKEYKDIIKSLDIFVTYPHFILKYFDQETKLKCDNFEYSIPAEYIEFDTSYKPIRDEVYYKVLSIPVDDVISPPGANNWIENRHFLPHPDSLASADTLDIDDFTHHRITGNYSLTYNKRLHLANTQTYLTSPINNIYSTVDDYGSGYNYLSTHQTAIAVTLNTTDGKKIVVKEIDVPVFGLGGPTDNIYYKHFYLYPDARAIKLDIIVKDDDSDNWSIFHSFELTKHSSRNFAYVNTQLYSNIDLISGYPYAYGSVPVYSSSDPAFDFSNVDTIIHDANRVQLSQVDNPLYYPAENSYRIDTQDTIITGMKTTLDAMSEGQYGHFPLYIFTNKGIWTLEVGAGNVIYSNIANISNHISSNSNAIIAIRNAIIFVTTDDMYLIAGRQVQSLAGNVKGHPSSYLDTIPEYQQLTAGLTSGLMNESIIDYLQTSIAAYSQLDNELIFVRNDLSYSLSFNIETQNWFTRNSGYKYVVNKYTEYVVIKESRSIYSVELQNDAARVDTLYVSRPLNFETIYRKQLHNSWLRMFTKLTSLTSVTVAVFASNYNADSRYKLLSQRKITSQELTEIEDFKLPFTKFTSAKYFIIVIRANLSTSHSQITHFDFSVRTKYAARLR